MSQSKAMKRQIEKRENLDFCERIAQFQEYSGVLSYDINNRRN